MKTAYIFPGQGAQKVGMGKALADLEPAARQVFEQADDVLGMRLSNLCFEGPEDELKLTSVLQPAILTTSVAALRVIQSRAPAPDFAAGHSLGEYSALVAAGSVEFDDALRLVRARGLFMQAAVAVGEGAMAAVLGVELATIEAACAEASSRGLVSPANLNSPGQTVIAGQREAVDYAAELLKARGARRVVGLAVSAPFHCELMRPAADRLIPLLEATRFRAPSPPVVSNVDAAVVRSGDEARSALARQVTAPVKWTQSVELLLAEGVTRFVEVGPGRVLGGLVKQVRRDCQTLNVEDPESLGETLGVLLGPC